MASEIEVLEDTTSSSTSLVAAAASTAPPAADGAGAVAAAAAEDESLKNDVYTAAAYGDLEKLQRLVEGEGRPVGEPDGGGYYALQWAALNNRVAAAQYILEFSEETLVIYLLGDILMEEVSCATAGLQKCSSTILFWRTIQDYFVKRKGEEREFCLEIEEDADGGKAMQPTGSSFTHV